MQKQKQKNKIVLWVKFCKAVSIDFFLGLLSISSLYFRGRHFRTTHSVMSKPAPHDLLMASERISIKNDVTR